MVFGPVACHQCCLAEYSEEGGIVHRSTPDPMAGGLAVTLNEVAIPKELAEDVEDQRVVRGVDDPLARDSELEEVVLLAHHVELRVTVKEPGGDELVKDTKSQRGQDSEEDVVQGQQPRLKDDLTREDILESVLWSS